MAESKKEGPYDKPLTDEEIKEWRQKAKTAFVKLKESAKTSSPPSSWVRSNNDKQEESWLKNRSEQCRYFDTHGFLILPGFCNSDMVLALKQQMADLADNDWNPSATITTFGTDSKSNLKRGDYFLDSSNRVHYFAEPHALVKQDDDDKKHDDDDDNGAAPQLRPEFQSDKLAALNKAGHGMHIIPGAFQEYTLSQQMRELVIDLGWKDPVVPQSMYIFKQPKIGGAVHSHQDSTFLYTTPRQTCLGLWLALDDATMENGCLWIRPGSHKEQLRRQFIRNPDYFEKNDASAPKLTFKQHQYNPSMTWEGELPPSLEGAGFVPAEVKAGDLVVFCGTLDHLSLPNFSDLQRHTFQLHLVEGPKEGVEWSPSNWLQYPSGASFLGLVD